MTGALDLASADLARNGHPGSVPAERLHALHTASLSSSRGQVVDDAELAARWQSWQAGGITEFQLSSARTAAAAAGPE